MKRLDSKGFGIVEGLLILIIVGIVGGTIFYVRKANNNVGNGSSGTTIAQQSQKQKPPTGTQPQQSHEDINKGYVVVKEWGVRIKLRDTANVTGYSYTPEAGDIFGEKYDSFITPEIKPYKESNTGCKDLGLSMFRSKTKFTGETKKVGDYYFLATGSPGQCADQANDPDNALHSRLIEDFNAANVELLP